MALSRKVPHPSLENDHYFFENLDKTVYYIVTMKTTILKNKPREIHYRSYKKFDSLKFIIVVKSN